MIILIDNAQPTFCHRDPLLYQKRCFTNQSLIMGAIAMYNMDHDVMIKEYNSNIYDLLIQEKYLSGEIITECDFFVEGDLSEGGYLYCVYHGAYGGQKKGTDIELSTRPKTDLRKKKIEKLIYYALSVVPTIIYYLIRFI